VHRARQYPSQLNISQVNLSDSDVSMSLILILVLYKFTLHILPMTTVATLFKAWVCGLSLSGIAGLNPAGGMRSVSYERCVLSRGGLLVGPITRPEESYRV